MTPDTGNEPSPAGDLDLRATAGRFVQARRQARPLATFPGAIPRNLEAAYRCQDAAIDLWPDEIAGWKVGRIPPALEARFGCDRLAGPIFRETIRHANGGDVVDLPVYAGGFAAIEAEFVIVVDRDADPAKLQWSLDDAAGMIRELRMGIEMASSPLKPINDLGPPAIVSDFGNNAGLLVGGPIRNWRERGLDSMGCEAFIQARSVGTGGAFRLTGGPVRSLQFILTLAASRGRPLRADDVIATGQTTGSHDIEVGETGRVVFGSDGEVACRAVRAKPGSEVS
jgi:2-keto-4-pentenoate hydratase